MKHAGQYVDINWSAPGFAEGPQRPSGSGIPVLFPFPGRIQGTVFHWEGKDYSLPAGDGQGNACAMVAISEAFVAFGTRIPPVKS